MAGVAFGLVDEAKRPGASLNVNEAGGCENLNIQRQQIPDCRSAETNDLVIGAISATGLDNLPVHAFDGGT